MDASEGVIACFERCCGVDELCEVRSGILDKERFMRIKKELNWEWSDISYVVNQKDVMWLIEQLEKTRELYKTDVKYYMDDSKDAKFAIDMLESENKRYHQTIDFLKLKLVDFKRHTEMIRKLAENELIRVEAERLKEDISDTFKAVEQQNS